MKKIEPNAKPKVQAAKKEDRPRYRKIDPRIWNDFKFNRLSATGQFLFLYLLTHSNLTSIGLLKIKKEALAHERDWDKEAFFLAFDLASQLGLLEYDECGLICLPNFIKYNEPESLTVVKGWRKARAYVPECPLFYKQVTRLKKYCENRGKNFVEAFYCAFPDFDNFPNYQEVTEFFEDMVKPNSLALFEPQAEPNRKPNAEPKPEADRSEDVSLSVRYTVNKELRTKSINEKEISKEKAEKNAQKNEISFPYKSGDQVPENFKPIAKEIGVDPQAVFDELVNYCLSTGKTYRDYSEAYRFFCKNHAKKKLNQAKQPPAMDFATKNYPKGIERL